MWKSLPNAIAEAAALHTVRCMCMCVQMNSRGFLKRRKHDTKKASAPPPSTSTASRYEEEEAQVHGYS